MSASTAYKHYLRALSRWPKDAMRPELQFQDVMRTRVDRRFLPQIAPNSSAVAVDERAELEQANALYSLLDNRYSLKFPITGSLMKPASNPTHYTDLVRELEEAPQRGWFARLMKRVKGSVRFS